jgi:hypothetical protein
MAVPVDSLPNLLTVHRNTGIGLEAQFHARASNLEHRDLEQAMKAIGPADHNRFLTLPRQD